MSSFATKNKVLGFNTTLGVLYCTHLTHYAVYQSGKHKVLFVFCMPKHFGRDKIQAHSEI